MNAPLLPESPESPVPLAPARPGRRWLGAAIRLLPAALLAYLLGCSEPRSPLRAIPAPPSEPPAIQRVIYWDGAGALPNAVTLEQSIDVRFSRPWKYIVIHHSATPSGSACVFDRMHRERGFDELGYHFVICNGIDAADGAIEIGGRWHRQKWGAHTGNTPGNEYNLYGIGICVVGDFRDRLPTPRQLAALKSLVEQLARRYGVEPRHIIGHRDAPGASTECPGDALADYLRTHVRPAAR